MDSGRHRMLEGVLLRLARHRDLDAFALRGGMRIRQLFPAAGRPALDVDLVWCGPVDEPEITRRLRSVLEHDVADGVRFGTERIRVDAMHVGGELAGYRYVVAGHVDGSGLDLFVDVRTDLQLCLTPTCESFRVKRGAGAVFMCQPETLVARKLQVIAEAGPTRWRPKDLLDVHRLLGIELDDSKLERAIANASGGEMSEIRELLHSESWWKDRRARMRWRRAVSANAAVFEAAPMAAIVASLRGGQLGRMTRALRGAP